MESDCEVEGGGSEGAFLDSSGQSRRSGIGRRQSRARSDAVRGAGGKVY